MRNVDRIFCIFLTCFFFILFILNFFYLRGAQQFTYLAQSFLHGKLFFVQDPGGWWDAILYKEHYFWHLGPFPAVLLMPLVLSTSQVGIFFFQGYLQAFLVTGVFITIFSIAQKIGFGKSDSAYWAYAFCFASTFLGVAFWQWSWFFSQVIAVLLLFLALHEHVTVKRQWVIGSIMTLLLLTRITASVGILFFIFDVIVSRKQVMKNLIKLLLPFAIGIVIWLGYNYARYSNPLEQGIGSRQQLLADFHVRAKEYGLFGLTHVPTNLFYSLINLPQPVHRENSPYMLEFPFIKADQLGMSIFVTTPYLIYLFFFKYEDTTSRLIWLTCAIVIIPTLLFFSTGFRQFGYRYALDILPFFHFLLIKKWHERSKRLTSGFKHIILCSSLFNLFLFLTQFIR